MSLLGWIVSRTRVDWWPRVLLPGRSLLLAPGYLSLAEHEPIGFAELLSIIDVRLAESVPIACSIELDMCFFCRYAIYIFHGSLGFSLMVRPGRTLRLGNGLSFVQEFSALASQLFIGLNKCGKELLDLKILYLLQLQLPEMANFLTSTFYILIQLQQRRLESCDSLDDILSFGSHHPVRVVGDILDYCAGST